MWNALSAEERNCYDDLALSDQMRHADEVVALDVFNKFEIKLANVRAKEALVQE